MDKFVVEGQHPLAGPLPVSGSKNAALPLMAGAVLAPGVTTLRQVPDLRDIHTFSDVIRVAGADVTFDLDASTLTLDCTRIDRAEAPYELVKKMRASFYMLGALLGRCGRARVSLPGGCAWGPRPVDLHLKGLEAFGASIALDEGYVVAEAPGGRLPGGAFRMEPSSVGATINLLLGAVLAEGPSRIDNAAQEPDAVAFGRALQQMGAQIDGLGTRTIEVQGVDALHPIDVRNTPDRIEMGTFMIAAAIAGTPGEAVRITDGHHPHLGDDFKATFAATGVEVTYDDDLVTVTPPDALRPVSIETATYPGFPTDLQAQWTVLLACADGEATVTDTIYTDRFKHVPELQRLGLDARVDGPTVTVRGGRPLTGATVMSTDLRASVSLVLAGMIAKGTTDVLRVYHLDRGYEHLEDKLSAAGAAVRRATYDEFATPDALRDA
jgi:UDP-N-acetylglucosamine 1-carboxyvinyltransferase